MDKYIALRGKSKSYSYRRRHSKEQATYYQQPFFNMSLQTRELSVARARAHHISKLYERNQKLLAQGEPPEPITIHIPERTKTRTELANELLSQFVSITRDMSTIPDDAVSAINFALQEYAEDQQGDVISERVPVVTDAISLLEGREIKEDLSMTQIVSLFLEIKGPMFDDKMTKLALNEWVTEMGDRPLSQYKRIHAQEFVNSFAARGKSSGTAKRRLGALKAAMRKVAVMHELDIKPLFDGVELEVVTQQRYQLTKDDEDKTLSYVGDRSEISILCLVLYRTGCRLAEIVGLQWKDVYLDKEIPYIEIRERENRSIKTKASSRVIPLVGEALDGMALLKSMRLSQKYCFPRYTKNDQTNADLAAAAIKKRMLFGSHSYRHLLTTRMHEHQIPEGTQRAILGHTSAGSGAFDGYGTREMLVAKQRALTQVMNEL
jgi:integrase